MNLFSTQETRDRCQNKGQLSTQQGNSSGGARGGEFKAATALLSSLAFLLYIAMDEEQMKKAKKTIQNQLLGQQENPHHGDDEVTKTTLEFELEIEEAALSSLDTEIILLGSKSELLDTKYEWREICAVTLTEQIKLLKRKMDMLRELQPAPSSADLLEQLSLQYSETKYPNRFCTYILKPEAVTARAKAERSWVRLNKDPIEMEARNMNITFKEGYDKNELVDEILTVKEERGEPLAR